jgi:PAS domain S-box-containing protein
MWRIVIVEDSPEDRGDIRRLLLKGSDRRYQFIEAETGAAGLRCVLDTSNGPPDCVVLDYTLPDMDALEVLAGTLGADGLTVCPVVVVTGTADARLGPAVLRAGAQDFIGKSWISAESLTRAVENAVERWAMTRELQARTVALQTSERQLKLAVEVAGLGVNRIDYNTGTVVLDPIAAALFGLVSGVPLPRSAIHATFHPEDKDEIVRRMQRSLDPTGEGTFSMEHRVVHPDGSVHWLAVKKLVVFAETHGIRGPVSSVLAAMDITDRKTREEQLRTSEEFNRSLMDGTADCVKVLDLAGRLVHMNTPGLCALEIDDFESVRGQQWDALWPAGARGDIERCVLKAVEGEVSSFQAYCPTAKGTPKWWEVTVSPVRDREGGQVVRLLAMSRDVTERRRADEERQLLVSVVENASDFIGATDAEGKPSFINSAALKLVGLDDLDQVRRTSITDYFVPDERKFVEEVVLPAVTREGRWTGELTFQHFKTKAAIPVLYDIFRVNDPATGRPISFATVTRDFTQRKKVEAELQRVNGFLDTLLRTAPIGFCFLDLNLRCQRVNEYLAHINGVSIQAHLGRHVADILPTMAESVRAVTDHILATGQAVMNQEHFGETPAAPGVVRFWNANWYPVHDGAGEIEGFGVIVEETTARKVAQETIAQQIRDMDALYSTTPAGLFQLDMELRYLQVNAWMAAINGRTIEAHIGRSVREVLDTPLGSTLEILLRQVLQSGEPILEVELHGTTPASPEERDWVASYHPIRGDDGEVSGVHGAVQDITERKRRERNANFLANLQLGLPQNAQIEDTMKALGKRIADYLKVSRCNFIEIDEPTFVANVISDHHPEGQPSLVGCHDLHQLNSPEELRELSTGGVQGINDVREARPAAAAARLEALGIRSLASAGYVRGGVWKFSLGVQHSQPRECLPDELELLRNLAGRIYLLVERERAEDKLRQLAADLSEADRRKDEFLATLAHELRNPLAPIRNGLQLLKLAAGQPATIEKARAMMDRQLTQMVRLVDDLMDVSRINLGKLELRKERLALAAVVNSAVETSRPLIEEMDHELTVSLPEQPLMVDADMTRLAQVFMNLLNNAAKYSDRGGHIRLNADLDGSEAVVTVTDTGIGIDADELPRIFGMFSQISGALERAQGGLGIGLMLVKRLVELHGGSVEARSEGLGLGSMFTVRLPVFVDAVSPQALDVDDEAEAMKSLLRILIVDDNRDAADSLSELLTFMGNDTRTAYDGQQGVDAAGEYRPDVILLDIGLPRLNGFEACRLIREQPRGKRVVIIALTGWGQEEDRRRSREAGFDHHLVKPVDPQALMKMIADLVVS